MVRPGPILLFWTVRGASHAMIQADGVAPTPFDACPKFATHRRPLAEVPSGSWRCGAYTGRDFIVGFLVEGVRPQDIESLSVVGLDERYVIEYHGALEERADGAYAAASTWAWTPAVFTPRAEIRVRFVEGAAAGGSRERFLSTFCVDTTPEYHDSSATVAIPAALLGDGEYIIAGSIDGFVLSRTSDPGLRLNPF
jgi:hypothetical protein